MIGTSEFLNVFPVNLELCLVFHYIQKCLSLVVFLTCLKPSILSALFTVMVDTKAENDGQLARKIVI